MARNRVAYGAAGAMALLGIMLAAGSAEARCRGMVDGEEARGQIRFFTEGKARRNWSARVTRRYSAEYANWSLARERRMNCRKRMPGRTWHCVAHGIACNRSS
jgi:hypothetical protein